MAEPEVVGEIPPKTAEPKRRPTKVLPTTRVGFPKQMQLLRTFAELATPEKPATTPEVSKVVGIHPGTAAYALPFLTDIFLQKVGSGYTPVPAVVAYHKALAWNTDTAGQKLAPLLRSSWFGRAVLPKLALKPMEEREVLSVFAEEAGATKEYAGALGMLLDYLVAASLVRREGGMVHAVNGAVEEQATRPESEIKTPVNDGPRRTSNVATAFNQAPEGVLRFNVDVSVDMREFSTWKPERIAAFWAGIAKVLAAKAAVEEESSR